MSLYDDFNEAKIKLKFWKDKELKIRNEILEEMASDKDEGNTTKIVDSMKITATYKMNRNIDEAVLKTIKKNLSEEELNCIKYKPEIVLKEYRKLEEEGESKLLEAVTLKPAQGSVVIKHI